MPNQPPSWLPSHAHDLWRQAQERMASNEQRYMQQHQPVGGIRGPAPVMPTMPQVPTMQNLPMQGGMVDFNALAGMMAGPIPDMSQFFGAPQASQPSQPPVSVPVIDPGMPTGFPQLPPSAGIGRFSPVEVSQGGGPVAQAMNATSGSFDKETFMRARRGMGAHPAILDDPRLLPGAMLDPRMGGLI